jgi:hypothetical protein
MTMNNDEIKIMLARNGIGWIEDDGRILAHEVYFYNTGGFLKAGCMQNDVTDFSAIELEIFIKNQNVSRETFSKGGFR